MSPHHRKIGTLLAILATAAAGSALAGSANAAIVSSPLKDVVDNDPVQVLVDPEVKLIDANVAFAWGSGSTDSRLTGTLHIVDGDDARFRVKLASYDRSSKLLGTTYNTLAGTPIHTDAAKDIAVDMKGTSAPFVSRVEVSVQKQGTGDKWRTKGTNNTPFLNLADDDVTILGTGIDVGGSSFFMGAPLTPAKLRWALGDDGKMTGTYDGYLHFQDFSRCGRVELRYLSQLGLRTATVDGPQHCPADDAHYQEHDTLAAPASSLASKVEVAMQSKTGGVWQDVNTQTVSIAE
jgi:hypothetical protein